MLDNETIREIEKLVSIEPRSINEIALHLKKNWRTVDRYLKQIEEETGLIRTKTFRGGTRGALKVAFLNSPEKISSTKFQEELEKQILTLRKKGDVSAFEIYEHVSDNKKHAIIENQISNKSPNVKELIEILQNTKKELRLFSGNLSWINLEYKGILLSDVFEELLKKDIRVKILCRVDMDGIENINKVLSSNYKYGKELIEIRHKEHSLRGFIIDDKIIRLKEVKEPTGKIKELDKKKFIFYTIKDKSWTEWLSKIFNKMFNTSVGSEKRLIELNKLLK
ncbi:hypothetical protein KAS08_03790 [Candidatus Pacearchaeota archaeon]|nr:hypothetical protein [Candidatus Pacearchaeota archaeon]